MEEITKHENFLIYIRAVVFLIQLFVSVYLILLIYFDIYNILHGNKYENSEKYNSIAKKSKSIIIKILIIIGVWVIPTIITHIFK